MAEQTFKSPGFFEQELELTAERQEPQGVPAGIIGAAKMGPAFIPLTVGTFTDFENRFGSLSPEKFAPYAVKEWLENRQSVTFLRVLGAGANSTATHFQGTRNYGFVNKAGFMVQPAAADKTLGSAQFLSAEHTISAASDVGFPLYTDNDEFSGTREEEGNTLEDDTPHKMIRGMLLNTSGSMFLGINNLEDASSGGHGGVKSSMTTHANQIYVNDDNGSNFFYLQHVLDGYTSVGDIDLTWGNDKATPETESSGTAGGEDVPNRIYKCSFDPDSQYYVGKVLNTDPKKFQEEGHLLWLDLGIENELASVDSGGVKAKIVRGIGSGSTLGRAADYASAQGSKTEWNQLFGLFNARYQAPKTTKFISQPYGTT